MKLKFREGQQIQVTFSARVLTDPNDPRRSYKLTQTGEPNLSSWVDREWLEARAEAKEDALEIEVCAMLRQARATSRLRQVDVAKQAGISVFELSRIENGKRIPSFSLAARIATVCGSTFTVKVEP